VTVVRWVKARATDIAAVPRARRRRAIPKGQLALALDGLVEPVYAYSFIATNLDVSTPAKAVAVEAWHRMRTDIEDRIRMPSTVSDPVAGTGVVERTADHGGWIAEVVDAFTGFDVVEELLVPHGVREIRERSGDPQRLGRM
jgi:hypothetical protein